VAVYIIILCNSLYMMAPQNIMTYTVFYLKYFTKTHTHAIVYDYVTKNYFMA